MYKSNSIRKRILAAAAAGILLLSLPMSGCNKENNDESSVPQSSKDTKFGDNIVAQSESYKISFPLMQYLYNSLYYRFLDSYGSYYFDTSKSLSEQYVDADNTQSWHDYFVEMSKNYIQQTIVFAEAGNEAGTKITDENLAAINTQFDKMEEEATEKGLSLDEYIKKNYGDGVTREEIEKLMKMSYLAQNYANDLYDSFSYTDEQLEKYYSENKNQFSYADYMSYSFSYSTINDEGTSMVIDEEKKTESKEYADALANCKTSEDFEEYIKKYLKANPSLVSMTTASAEASVTEEDFNQAVDNQAQSAYSEFVPYSDSSDVLQWVFEDGRKEGDTTVIDTGAGYVAVLILKPAYRDEAITRDIRHILVAINENPAEGEEKVTDAQAKEKAEQIYREWLAGDATEETFAELAAKYSDDPGSASNGGLYEDVREGTMVQPFNDWMFDSSRQGGDHDVVKTDFGYHVMYFVKTGKEAWKSSVDQALREQSRSEKYEDLSKKYTVEIDDTALNDMEIIVPETETEENSESTESSE